MLIQHPTILRIEIFSLFYPQVYFQFRGLRWVYFFIVILVLKNGAKFLSLQDKRTECPFWMNGEKTVQ
uniref:Uncharacterized protein n=1 Tax=Bartonella rochalimae ATCC BAA-1498 TaxID=685782 RepID=E6YNG5_9HYPH|nr:hypothetical protein BARRO_130047 [Bartonella rochalimae ATCC BAA-1498]